MTSQHPALPPRVSRPWILGAVLIWGVMALVGPTASPRHVGGPFEGTVTLRSHIHDSRYGRWALASSETGVSLLVELDDVDADRGDHLVVRGMIEAETGIAAGRPYGGVLDVLAVDEVESSDFLPHLVGNWVRSVVQQRLQPYDDGRALLAGFLIGDVSRIEKSDVEAMRRSGLAHFVAVSGSNVALYLALLAIVAGPLALGPRRRALLGLLGLPIYAAATRFEPSVMRASVMAGLALGGRLVGIVLEAWQLLSLAVAVLVIIDPVLTTNVGFQLSVAATAGVLVGARWPVPGRVGRALAITVGAQLAVAPLLIWHFGSVPLLSPLVNLVAAPLVALATLTSAIGVIGVGFLVSPAAWMAEGVLALARGAAAWPQLGVGHLVGLVLVAGAVIRYRWLRPTAALAGAMVLVLVIAPSGGKLAPGSVAVLDVGQGDAILISGGEGRFSLVDGGPDPSVTLDRLRAYGVTTIELVVLTHPHADHVTGLTGIVGQVHVAEIWANPEPHSTPASRQFFDKVTLYGIPVVSPSPGESRELGTLELRVRGPMRRYASPNDQSIVIEVIGPQRTMLLSGDIETFAQADLNALHADILKVPHQGAATSDPDWLASVGADLAVISVGPNEFGHPADSVIDVLETSGARVVRTDRDGDVVVDLSTEET